MATSESTSSVGDAHIAKCFDHHPPSPDAVALQHVEVRENCRQLAQYLQDTLPVSREKSLVLTKFEEALFWANAAIARNQ